MKQLILVTFASAILLSAGCSTPAIKDANLVRMSAAEQAKSTEQSPQEVIDAAKENLVEAREEELSFYSPTYLAEAEKEIDAAERSLLSGEESSIAVANALLAQQWISRGLKNKEVAQIKLKASLDALNVLDEIEAQKYLGEDYLEFKNDIKELIVLLEQEKAEEAIQEQKDILESFAELEVETLNAAYLKPVLVKLEEAEDQDADDYAEKTLADAQQQATALETYIKIYPRNRSEIAELSKHASKAAMHAKQVALAARPLLKLNTEKAEKHILAIEQYLARIGKALNHEDVRYMSLDNQSIAIAQIAETTARRAKAFDRQQDWEKQKQSLTEKVSLLEVALATSKAQLEEARRSVVVSVAAPTAAPSEKEQALVAVPVKATSTKEDKGSKTDKLETTAPKLKTAPETTQKSLASSNTAKASDADAKAIQNTDTPSTPSPQTDNQPVQMNESDVIVADTETQQKTEEPQQEIERQAEKVTPASPEPTIETQTANIEVKDIKETDEVTDLTAQNN